MTEPVPHQVHQVGGHDFLLGLPGVEPPLRGHRHRTHECLRVERRQLRVQPAAGEVAGQNRGNLADGVVEQAGVGTGTDRGRGVADHDPESVGAFLDVGQQRQRHPFDPNPRTVVGQRGGDAIQQGRHLPVDDHRVEPLLAAEVLVDHRLGHPGALGDLFHRGAFIAAFGKQCSGDVDELVPTLAAGHSSARYAWLFPRSGHGYQGISPALKSPTSNPSWCNRQHL